jgi:hypothetical protein
MDLKKFLLLPLTYVESVWKCLNTIKNKTNKSNCDYIPINTVLQSLEIYVQKSKINLTKYSINEDDDGDFSNSSLASTTESSSSSSSSTESIELTSDDRFKSIIMDGYDFSKLNSKFLIYSSKVNYRSLNKKWDKVSLSLSLYSLILILSLFFFN